MPRPAEVLAMTRSIRILASLALLAACVPAAHAALPAPVTLDGISGATPGMTAATVSSHWRVKLEPEAMAGSDCSAAAFLRKGVAGYAIFLNDRFGAVFFRKGVRTPAGISIGSTRKALKAAYGTRLRSRPNKYAPGARDYFLRRKETPRWQLRFDVAENGKVVQIAFGDKSVELVEGCA